MSIEALIVVDAQNEFSSAGQHAVSNHTEALAQIQGRVNDARKANRPVAWIRHFNKSGESRAFVPGTWGSELSPGLGPQADFEKEKSFEKNVYGAFTGTSLEEWLRSLGVTGVLIVGFYTHMCLSTTAREALVRGFEVTVDPDATGARELEDQLLGKQTADEVRRSALLHIQNMGVTISRKKFPQEPATYSREPAAASSKT
jgi:nicotinamidase-related amidase